MGPDTAEAFPGGARPKKPLDSRPVPEQNEILLSVAQQMKEAALGASRRFRNQSN